MRLPRATARKIQARLVSRCRGLRWLTLQVRVTRLVAPKLTLLTLVTTWHGLLARIQRMLLLHPRKSSLVQCLVMLRRLRLQVTLPIRPLLQNDLATMVSPPGLTFLILRSCRGLSLNTPTALPLKVVMMWRVRVGFSFPMVLSFRKCLTLLIDLGTTWS